MWAAGATGASLANRPTRYSESRESQDGLTGLILPQTGQSRSAPFRCNVVSVEYLDHLGRSSTPAFRAVD